MEIITNHQWRNFLYRYEVPEDILRNDLDWTTEEDIDGYIQYRGNYFGTGAMGIATSLAY